MEKMIIDAKIIDAKDLLLGRMGSIVAKRALLGEKIAIVNCEESVISGNRLRTIADYEQTFARGIPAKGPFYHSMPNKLVRRTIRGMLPYKKERGRNAFKNIHCFVGVPETLKDQKKESIKEAHMSKLPYTKYIRVKELCKLMGAKI